jgi:hypothetical protein
VIPGSLLIADSSSSSSLTQETHSVPLASSNQTLNMASQPISYPDYNIGDLVSVERRCWPGMNKEGGVGKITCRHEPSRSIPPNDNGHIIDSSDEEPDELHPTYDVTYVLGGKEQHIPAKYISLKRFEEVQNKPRSTLGRCRSD